MKIKKKTFYTNITFSGTSIYTKKGSCSVIKIENLLNLIIILNYKKMYTDRC